LSRSSGSSISQNVSITTGDITTDFADVALDAFGRLRVSQPKTIFDSSLVHTEEKLFWTESLTGSGTSTHLTNEAAMRLTVSTASGDKAIRQTRQSFRYQPGKSHQIFITGVMGVVKSNVRQRIGYFNENNGLFWEQDGTNLKVVRRTKTSGSVVDNIINQSSWNIDKLDGTGTSGITLDMSKAQIMLIDFQWLGVGRARMGFVIHGNLVYCHEFNQANIGSVVYMATGSLPIRYEIENTGITASSTDLKAICSSVLSEGGHDPLGLIMSVNTGINELQVTSTETPVVSIRLDPAKIGASIVPIEFHLLVVDNADTRWQIFHNPTLTGASWVSAGTDSVTQKDISATAISGGTLVASGYTSHELTTELAINTSLTLGADLNGTPDILTVSSVILNTSSSDGEIYGSITFRELG